MSVSFKILVTIPEPTERGIFEKGFKLLESKQCQLTYIKEASRAAILERVSGVDAIFWATKERLDAEVLDKAGPQMKTVGTMSVGLDHIDVPELKKRGVKLGNTPIVLDNAVADVAVLLALGAARRVREGALKIERDEWTPNLQWMLGGDIEGSTVGIVGFGRIGQAIVKRLKGFLVGKFLYTGHREKQEGKDLGAQFVNFDTLLKESDFVIIACPLTNETKHMFNDDAFGKMKSTSILVNIARGAIVDQDALVRALKTHKIFAAGLDVMTPEPLPAEHELVTLPNAFLIPHLGSATINTRTAMAQLTAQNILMGLAGEDMFAPVV